MEELQNCYMCYWDAAEQKRRVHTSTTLHYYIFFGDFDGARPYGITRLNKIEKNEKTHMHAHTRAAAAESARMEAISSTELLYIYVVRCST
jgi:hypothetical protein